MVNRYCVCTYVVENKSGMFTRIMDTQVFPNPDKDKTSVDKVKKRAKLLRSMGHESVQPGVWTSFEEEI